MKIFLAATHANVGKTITSLGLMAVVGQRFSNCGYMKPIGQQSVLVDSVQIDRDVLFMKEAFHLADNVADMSPVRVPRGYTEEYIRHPRPGLLRKKIITGFNRISKNKDFLLVEGTGHAGVGSVIDFSNSHVAHMLGLNVIIVAPGGIGYPIDEIMLNKALFDAQGVSVRGVILNRVKPDQVDRIREVAGKGLKRLGVTLLAVVAESKILSYPCMAQIAEVLHAEIVSGAPFLENRVENLIIGALPPHEVIRYFHRGTLLITPGNRDDMVLAAISSSGLFSGSKRSIAGVVLTCGFAPHRNIMRLLKKTGLPVIMVKEDTFITATRIDRLIVKMRPNDDAKIKNAIKLFQESVSPAVIINAFS